MIRAIAQIDAVHKSIAAADANNESDLDVTDDYFLAPYQLLKQKSRNPAYLLEFTAYKVRQPHVYMLFKRYSVLVLAHSSVFGGCIEVQPCSVVSPLSVGRW